MRALLLSAVLLVPGACSSTPPSSPATTPPPPATTPATTPSLPAPVDDAKVVEITVKGRSVSPPPGRVDVAKGQKVRLVVHSDTPDEIHLHGYDMEAKMGPGQDAVIEFVATQTGVFEVETHESGLLLTQLAVR